MASSLEKQVHVEEHIPERCAEQWDYQFPVVNQQHCLMSIVDCEDPQKPAAIKVFGCYPSVDSANAAAAKISSECDFFHVYVCPTNAWVPVPPSPEFIENVHYQESRMREIQETFAALKDRKAQDVIRHLNKESGVPEEEKNGLE
ncbi:unnamed protein product, partial [Ectocarpus sp. 8 AP-2014]